MSPSVDRLNTCFVIKEIVKIMWSIIYGSSDPLYQGHPLDKDKQCFLLQPNATNLSTNKESKH